jgi:hypothetical protein
LGPIFFYSNETNFGKKFPIFFVPQVPSLSLLEKKEIKKKRKRKRENSSITKVPAGRAMEKGARIG